jgi:two-component system, NarL family, sensor histidine kinase DegS
MSKPKILIAEENSEILKIFQSSLEPHNYDVIIAGDCTAIIKHLQKDDPDLIIMDLLLPKLDGWQILNLLDDRGGKNIPVIMISPQGLDKKVKIPHYPWIVECLTQPFTPSLIKKAVKKALNEPPPANSKDEERGKSGSTALSVNEKSLIRTYEDKVREYSILNEMSHIITTTIEIDALQQGIIELCVRVIDGNAGAIIMYDDSIKKFTVSHAVNLSERFTQKVKLSLSDPLIEDFITIRKEVAIAELQNVYSSTLLEAAVKEGVKSLLALPLLVKEKLIGILCVFLHKKRQFPEKERALLSSIAGQVAISIENARLYNSSRQKQMQVEKLLSKVIVAQEEERKRIAGEIHDSIAQSMVGILTKVQTSQSLLTVSPEKVAEELEELRKIVADSVKEVREIIFNLRPSSLDDLGLVPSLENVIKRIERDTGIGIDLIVNERDLRLPSILETVAFRIIQEALNNVKKHSEARKAWIELYFEPTRLSIKIVDNGKGFNWESLSQKFLEGSSFGFLSMKERASLVGGLVDITSEENKGTTVSVEIPINRSLSLDRKEV